MVLIIVESIEVRTNHMLLKNYHQLIVTTHEEVVIKSKSSNNENVNDHH